MDADLLHLSENGAIQRMAQSDEHVLPSIHHRRLFVSSLNQSGLKTLVFDVIRIKHERTSVNIYGIHF